MNNDFQTKDDTEYEMDSNNNINIDTDSKTSETVARRARIHQISKEQLVRLVIIEGMSLKDGARITGLKYSTCSNILTYYRKHGTVSCDIRGGVRKLVLTSQVLEALDEAVTRNASATLDRLKNLLSQKGINI